MIGKHIPSPKSNGSFAGLNDYISGKSKRRLDTEKVAFVDCVNLISTETATTEMESLALQNKRCADPVMHLLLSWRENECPSQEQVREAVNIALDEMNLSDCQAVYALHQNTDNMHLHICVNRVNPDTLKAVNPAHGWTRRGMERAARRIEHAQGWQTENNTWSEINEHGEIVTKPRPVNPNRPIPQKVQDMENLTGEQSAIRKAQNALKEKLKGLSSWEDFYNLLSLNGMKYQKKGSGAVITIDDVTVKASDVSRNLTLGKLEKQLGPYQEIHHLAQYIYDDKSKGQKVPQPLHDANRDSENWKAYIRAKAEHFDRKKERRQRLYMTQREERDKLRDRQKLERQALADSFGNGISRLELNRQRSILATKHAYERAVLKEKQNEQRKTLQTQTAAFISYEQWLHNLNLPEEAEKWRQRKNKRILLLEMPENTIIKEPQDYSGLSSFSMTVTRQGVKFVHQDNPEAVAFIDTGRLIKVYGQEDASILAALQLAQQKWGGVHVNGTGNYKRRCAELAVKNGIRIVNPELQDYIKELEREKEETAMQEKTAVAAIPFSELKKRQTELKVKLDEETRKIAEPRIAEAAKKQIETEALKIAAEKAAVYNEYLEAMAKQEAHAKKKPPEPLLFGHGEWQREHADWEAADKAMRSRAVALGTVDK
jgi:hypothetical protein